MSNLTRFIPKSRKQALTWLVVLVTLFSIVRITQSYRELSQTWDESDHLACGMQLLDRGAYDYETLHPPIARIAVATLPYLDGARSHNDSCMWDEGNDILYGQSDYWRTLTLARVGILPFFLISVWVLWTWSKKLYGIEVAALAVICFAFLPPLLGHSGVATTDVPLVAMLLLSSFTLWWWLQAPNKKRSLVLGCVVGLGVATKFSFLVFFPCSALFIVGSVLCQRRITACLAPQMGIGSTLASLGIVLITICMTVWAAYGFAVGPLRGPDQYLGLGYATPKPLTGIAFPAPAFFDGIATVRKLNHIGHASYFLGKRMNKHGSVFFFPVTILLKTPVAFLLLAAFGSALVLIRHRGSIVSQRWKLRAVLANVEVMPFFIASAILLVSLPSDINLGVRHILAIYPFLAILAALAGRWLWKQPGNIGAATLAFLLIWMIVSSLSAGADQFAYFNELAGSYPERYLLDDLDGGQDSQKAADSLRHYGAQFVSVSYNGSADLKRQGFPRYENLAQFTPPNAEWVAMSKLNLYVGDGFAWLRSEQPFAEIGRSILIYRFSDADLARIRASLGKSPDGSDIVQAEQVATAQPTPENFLNLSVEYYNTGRLGDCISAARKAIALKPDFAQAYNNICAANNRLGRFAEGKKAGEEAVRLAPSILLFRNNLNESLQGLSKQ